MSFLMHLDDDDYDDSEEFENYYQSELYDAPMGAGGFVKDIVRERCEREWKERK